MTTYKILGADGRQYGPVTSDQVVQWLKEGRANRYTKVCVEGTLDWRAIADLPEFAAFLTTPPVMPSSSTPGSTSSGTQDSAEALAAGILARDYSVNIGHCFSRAWDLVMGRFWFSVGVTALIVVLNWGLAVLPLLGHLLLTYVLVAGLKWMFLKMVRGQPVELSDAFAGFSKSFIPLMLFSLVAQLLTILGIALCILPGIYLAISWLLFGGLIILDKGLDFWPAMEVSRKVVTRHWWQMFALALLCILILLAGTLLCFIGFFVALPIVMATIVYAYEDIFGAATPQVSVSSIPQGPAPSETPPAPQAQPPG